MAKKNMCLKKQTASPLKPNIFSIQIFPPLWTTTKPNNHSKQGFYTKKKVFQTSKQVSIKNRNKFHTKFHTQIHTKISYISIPDYFFSLNFSFSLLLFFFFFFFLSSSLLSFSLLLFSLPLCKSLTKMGYFGS